MNRPAALSLIVLAAALNVPIAVHSTGDAQPRIVQTRASSARVVVPPRTAAALAPLLQGLDANVAARGFRSLTEFVTVLHLAHNLEIPFPTLKKRVVTERIPLDVALRRMRPRADLKKELARAEQEARAAIDAGR